MAPSNQIICLCSHSSENASVKDTAFISTEDGRERETDHSHLLWIGKVNSTYPATSTAFSYPPSHFPVSSVTGNHSPIELVLSFSPLFIQNKHTFTPSWNALRHFHSLGRLVPQRENRSLSRRAKSLGTSCILFNIYSFYFNIYIFSLLIWPVSDLACIFDLVTVKICNYWNDCVMIRAWMGTCLNVQLCSCVGF